MPRNESRNDFQVAFKVPRGWVEQADRLAARAAKVGLLGSTRTDVLRTALQGGLEKIESSLTRAEEIARADAPRARKKRTRK